jgi:hypothetical protein
VRLWLGFRASRTLLSAVVVACAVALGAQPAAGAGSQPPSNLTSVEVLADTPGLIVVRCEPASSPGAAATGDLSRIALVRVPDHGRISARCEPEGRALVSDPGIVRDLRVVQVTFDIPADDPRPVTVTLTIESGPGPNERTPSSRPSSPAFESLYRGTVVNYTPTAAESGSTVRSERLTGARYLIITDPAFATEAQILADWKNLKGVKSMVVTLNETGTTAEAIKAYIQNAYDTWAVPPEYVLLVGDTEVVPMYYSETWTDDYYGNLEGSDYFVDVMVGRLSADTAGQCEILVAKILSYERTPIEGDAQWPASGLLTVADDFDEGDDIYYANTWFVYDKIDSAGFAPIDTLFNRNSVTPSPVYASWNAGRGYVNFRGVGWMEWPSPFNINPALLTNTNKLSVVVSATCGTGVFYDDGFICERVVRAGSVSNLIGAVAFLGTSTSIESSEMLSQRRGAADQGFFTQAFGPDGGTLGAATLAAKMAIYNFDQVKQEYEGWNLLGDPDMQLWTAQPETMQVVHGDYYHASEDSFVVTVLSSGQPLEGALVACVKGTDIYAWGYSDEDGRAVFALAPTSVGTMAVTVTARNHYPYEGSVSVLDTGPYLICTEMIIDDSAGGNGDGLLSPREGASIMVRLRNAGDVGAVRATATLRTPDPLAAIIDSVATYGTIPPGGSAWSRRPFGIVADRACAVGHEIPLDMDVTFGATTRGVGLPPLALATVDMDLVSAIVDDAAPGGDGDRTAGTGETVGLVISLENVGLVGAKGVSMTLESVSPYITVTSGDAHLGIVEPGADVSNAAEPFVLSVSPTAPNGQPVELQLNLTGDGWSYSYEETIVCTLEIAGPTTSVFSGPDEYGYYAYDSRDTTYAPAPEFAWYDISPPGPGSLITQITNSDAAITTINLPFIFSYYGTLYFQASVCSNGFISMGSEDYKAGTNSAVGSGDGPDRMIAPFWDDLNPLASGDIYRWQDGVNHRLIIQFDNVPIYGTTDTQTFQMVFLNPSYYPTPTGDGEILFLYENVTNPSSCTVGIENPEQTGGIGYLYNGTYDSNASPLADGLAVLFTTVGAMDPTCPWLTLDSFVVDDATGNGNGLAEPGETVSVALTLRNIGETAAAGVTSTLEAAEEGLAQVLDGASAFTDVPVSGSGSNAADPFVIQLSEAIDDTVVTLWALVGANDGSYSAPVRCDLHINLSATGVPDTPLEFAVHHPSPNPFTGTTTVALALPAPAPVTLSVYDIAGRLVRRIDRGVLAAGSHTLRWDGRDGNGRSVGCGVYFLRVAAGDRVEDRKAVLLR